MAIAKRIERYLIEQDVDFDMLNHPHSATSMETAEQAHISGNCIAKSVLLEDESGYLLAVVPASCRVDLGELHRQTSRNLGLATEYQLGALFEDCEPGAVPPFGAVYEMDSIVEDSLAEQPDIYFEAGDHEQLIRVSSETFASLVGEAQHLHFSRHI